MNRFRTLLVPIDGDPSRQPVLARAARLAKQNGAVIKLIAVVEDLPWYTRLLLPTAEELQTTLVGDKSAILEGLAAPLRRDGVEVCTKILRGRRSLEMIREVIRDGHDLLMKEAEPNENLLFGSTDMHLLRQCPCPVWIIKPDHADRPFAKILAGVDPAPAPDDADLFHLKSDPDPKDPMLDGKILELAGSLAEGEGGELHVVHAWSAPGESLLRGQATLSDEQVDRYVEDSCTEAQKALDTLLARSPAAPGRRFVHLLKGGPADVIADFAKTHDIDLIVMGTIARTGIPGLFIGNTAESILQRVDCSVLAVKPDGFVSPVGLEG